jgi:hypothetical protein
MPLSHNQNPPRSQNTVVTMSDISSALCPLSKVCSPHVPVVRK